MMSPRSLRIAIATTTLALATAAGAIPPGATAPDFKGTDSNGQTQTLSQYKGKYVVLEWHNQGCPYEQKLYHSGTMEALQKQWTGKGVVWLSIISSAPGTQGYVTPAEENAYMKKMSAAPTATILDPTGKLIYVGAIDDQPSPDPNTLKGARNYVSEALTESMSGQPIKVASTRSYGCSVKYAGE